MSMREDAALICAIAASGGIDGCVTYHYIRDNAGFSDDSLVLAWKAYNHVRYETKQGWTRETDAEAEALIRTGWKP